jgi:translation elongation factor EF-Ts
LSNIGTNSHSTIDTHLASTSNPHSTTAAQVGAIGYVLHVIALDQATTTDSQTIYWGSTPAAPSTSAAIARIYIPKAGTIKAAYIFTRATTAGTGEDWSMYIRLNNTTDTLIETEAAAANVRVFQNAALSIAVSQADYIEIKEVHPAWATNPANIIRGGYIYIEP